MLPFNIGVPEVVVILGIALLVFGPKKLPELGRNLGKGLKNFKESLSSAAHEVKSGFNEEEEKDNKTEENKS
ncbi:MAG: twin-arginine translocase TatA/TatE family subunit [Candidatus Melainabacteria bacterium]|nr:twin-arginine translocase TatA/TatE family subunit [Candidatus Melainabacteria bacterium]MBI3308710.1 twin-arginine translocase TatA/TatE family subunit [Candidatus Melainabacteria bacterium]